MKEKIYSTLNKRTQMALLPFDEQGILQLWHDYTPREITDAIDILSAYPITNAIIDQTRYIRFNASGYTVEIYLPKYHIIATPREGLVLPDDDQRCIQLIDFAKLSLRIEEETRATYYKACSLIDLAGAAGQIKRAWPELLSFLSKVAANSTNGTQRASRMPKGWDETEFDSNKDLYNRVLAEALILPVAEVSINTTILKKPTPVAS